jgi:hypothetical protein
MAAISAKGFGRVGDGQRRYRIGLDIGGTLADFTLNDAATGAVRLDKQSFLRG